MRKKQRLWTIQLYWRTVVDTNVFGELLLVSGEELTGDVLAVDVISMMDDPVDVF